MQSPPLHHPVPQHRVNVEATAAYQTQYSAQGESQYHDQYASGYPGYQPAYQPGYASNGYPPSGYAPSGYAPGQQTSGQAGGPSSGAQSGQPSGYASGYPSSGDFNPLNLVGNTQLGRHAFSYGQQYLSKRFDSYGILASSLRYYFQVSNSYVRNKLFLIMFPWRHRPWNRQLVPVAGAGGQEMYAAPTDDVNAPDMYIPVMAFVTNLLVIALGQGIHGSFHPEQFGARASKALAVVISELMLLKVATYLLSASSSSLFDLFAYSGYKFIGLTLTTLVGLVTDSRTFFWLAFAYTGSATAFFMLRSLKYILLPEYAPSNAASTTTSISGSKRQQRIQFLFFYGVVCQLALMWLLL